MAILRRVGEAEILGYGYPLLWQGWAVARLGGQFARLHASDPYSVLGKLQRSALLRWLNSRWVAIGNSASVGSRHQLAEYSRCIPLAPSPGAWSHLLQDHRRAVGLQRASPARWSVAGRRGQGRRW